MKIKTGFIVIALIVAPNFAFAMGCPKGDHNITASSCAVGMVWDETKESCVTPTNT